MSTPTEFQIDVLRAAETREAGGDWAIRGAWSEYIEHGWLTEDYYLTDLGKRIVEKLKPRAKRRLSREADEPAILPTNGVDA